MTSLPLNAALGNCDAIMNVSVDIASALGEVTVCRPERVMVEV